MALRPVEFLLNDGETIAGVEEEDHSGHFTMVCFHDVGGDLDAMLPVLSQIGLKEARKIAIDLPGHGLSSGKADPNRTDGVLLELRHALRERNWGPFLFVAAGRTALHALTLADAPDTLGLCLVSPRSNGEPLCRAAARCPVLAFVSAKDDAASSEWLAIRSSLRSWWLAISIAVDHAALVTGEAASGQIASHLQGFARDMYATSPLLAGRIAGIGSPELA